MLLDPALGYFDEGFDLTDAGLYEAAHRGFGEATTLPPASYRSRIFSALEDNRVWARSWIAVGVEHQIPNPGDLLPFTIGYHGVHLQRVTGGSVIGRFNKAQHGGCRSVPLQCQTGSRTRCSFTSCGYSRDRGVIRADELDGDRSAAQQYLGMVPERLLPVRVDRWGPLLFACLDTEGPDLNSGIAEADRMSGLWPAAQTRLLLIEWLEVPANWKLVGPALHDLLAAASGGRVETQAGGPCVVETWDPDAVSSVIPKAEFPHFSQDDARPEVRLVWLFPNLVVLRLPNLLTILVLQPLSMDKTQIRLFLLAPRSVDRPASECLASLGAEWRAFVHRSGELARGTQESLEKWGTARQPGTDGAMPPVQKNRLSWQFQSYFINRLLEASR